MPALFASSSALAIPIASALQKADLIHGYLTNPDRPSGRNRIIAPNEFATWASESNLPVFKISNSDDLVQLIKNLKIELVITCAFGQIISKALLKAPANGWLNVHFSLLPEYRGAAPVQRAIMDGKNESGFTVFRMDEGIDTGDILYFEKIEIRPNEMASELIMRMANRAALTLPKIIESPSTWIFSKQTESNSSSARKITKDENRIDWKTNAEDIFNKYRALDLNGGIWGEFRGKRVDLSEIEISSKKLQPGSIFIEGKNCFVGTNSQAIRIIKIQPSGKRKIDAADWVNGLRLTEGEAFE